MCIIPLMRFWILCCVLTVCASAQSRTAAYVEGHREAVLQEFEALLAIPNVAADPTGLERNADTLVRALQSRGVQSQKWKLPGVAPLVYGSIETLNAKRTVVFYAHYDGQPVTPSEWQGGEPFRPVRKLVAGEERIYARSASDDKAAIMAQLVALDALRAAGVKLRANVRFVWEGEEEAGSAHLEQYLRQHREQVTGDVWLICDGPVDQSRLQSIAFGARGDTHLEVTVYGPAHELHSGHYGNWAPNPAMELAQLLGSMKDRDGHVLVAHFYDGVTPLSEAEKAAIAAAPKNEEVLRKEFALGHTDGGGRPLLELLNEPTLNVNGMSSARTGAKSNNVIPTTAVADLDLRLVKGLDWRTQQQRVIEHIRAQGYFVTEQEPTRDDLLSHPRVAFVQRSDGYNAVRTPMTLPIAREVIAAVESAHSPVVKLPTMGGSVPLENIERATGAPTITVPIANHDNNQHSANENIRLKNLWDGVETMAALLTME